MVMIIEYLKELENNPTRGIFSNEGIIEITKIQKLEQDYNNGNPFPKVLKELLFLAGNYCGYLDFGSYDTQQELQNEERLELLNVFGVTISRPHYFVDLVSPGNPVFMYLDEGPNPLLYQINNNPTQSNYTRDVGGTLKDLIEERIQSYKEGHGPF